MREVVDTKTEFEQAVFDYETAGWETVEQSQGRAVLERGLRGSWAWHILFLFIAPIYGNLLYSAYRCYDRPEQFVVRRRMDTAADGETGLRSGTEE